MKWNLIWGDDNLPKKTGNYLVTVTSVSAEQFGNDVKYTMHSRTTMAWFRITKRGYHWTWDDEFGSTDTMYNDCERSWTYDGTAYYESIDAWAEMPEPYGRG